MSYVQIFNFYSSYNKPSPSVCYYLQQNIFLLVAYCKILHAILLFMNSENASVASRNINPSICHYFVTIFLLALTNVSCRRKMTYQIQTQWNSQPINHKPVQIELSWKPHDDFVTAVFKGPYFNDPDAPNGPPGKPFPMLWEYEGIAL